MTLKLFRRHEKECLHSYLKEDKIFEWDSPKSTGRAQCNCLIAVDGRVGTEYLRNKTTGCRDWIAARKVVDAWINAGNAHAAYVVDLEYKLVTIEDAIATFLMVQKNKENSDERLSQYTQLFTLRLLPFAKSRNIEHIQEMDNSKIWAEFRNSWINLNPLQNRKPAPGEVVIQKPMGKRTASRFIGDLRSFLRFCELNEWLSANYATRDYGMVTSKIKDPKEPFSDQDVWFVYSASGQVTDGKGGKNQRTGTQNGFEAYVFALVLRYTGLRIGDVCALEGAQLVPFRFGIWEYAISCNPIKTTNTKENNHVLIPIPNGNLPGHPNVVAALRCMPLKHDRFFFLGGGPVPEKGTDEWKKRLQHATNGWRERINRLFVIAARMMKAEGKSFSVHPHPHRFRHTFAAWMLQMGMSTRIVAEYLCDTEETVRSHYGKFCVAEQEASARAFGEKVMNMPIKIDVNSASPWRRLLG